MKKIYTTKEWNGCGKQNYYHNEYRLEGNEVSQYKCNRFKFFDGKENNWEYTEKKTNSWNIEDPSMPEWLKKHL